MIKGSLVDKLLKFKYVIATCIMLALFFNYFFSTGHCGFLSYLSTNYSVIIDQFLFRLHCSMINIEADVRKHVQKVICMEYCTCACMSF